MNRPCDVMPSACAMESRLFRKRACSEKRSKHISRAQKKKKRKRKRSLKLPFSKIKITDHKNTQQSDSVCEIK